MRNIEGFICIGWQKEPIIQAQSVAQIAAFTLRKNRLGKPAVEKIFG